MAREKGKMQPIRDREKIEEMKNWLLVNKGYKYYMLFILGINTGLRVSDLLKMKVKDVRSKIYVSIVIQKTQRELELVLTPYVRQQLETFIEGKKETDYLFTSRVGVNKPLTTVMASMVIKEAGEAIGLEKINTHSMRKTFGYWFYKETKDVYTLMELFGHQTQEQTKRYIGVRIEEIEKKLENFGL